ncbi:LPS export ABC transporter permease LptG [Aquibium sp. ELW1220]|uniref:LPS export ABC transporter permease LptG n=1 Tax=Aquibium sp. ELW1220 TaxID=2976766 RepID=UPI0025B26557|nr:LPS export ABC transporter permease LptG [Aquibium sp. ELW1220]MDN2583075.1 LPS export ABC transporter permease LptG [Aquibium sp. ELW1220]
MIGWTLGRYFFRRYIVITMWFLIGIFSLIFIIDFTEQSSRLSGLPGYSLPVGLLMTSLRSPMVLQITVPFIALFAAMATLIALNRKYELVIARAAGISAWQFLLPACVGAFVFGLASVLVLNPIAAYGFSTVERMESDIRSGKSNKVSASSAPWLRQRNDDGDIIIGARAVLDGGLALSDVVFLHIDKEGGITERQDAKRADLADGEWILTDVRGFKSGDKPVASATARVPTNLRPEFVQQRLARPEATPFFELSEKIETAKAYGYAANGFSMQYHSLVALPVLMVAMTLIAATVSMGFVRLGQSGTLILGGIAAGFLLYVVTTLVKAFGSSGIVPPVVAAWVPVVIAMFFGVTFLLYKEDG